MSEITGNILDGLHMDDVQSAAPGRVDLWHNGDYVDLVGECTVTVTRIQEGAARTSEVLHIKRGHVVRVQNFEGTSQFPGDWTTRVDLVSRADYYTADELELLRKQMQPSRLGPLAAIGIGAFALGLVLKGKA